MSDVPEKITNTNWDYTVLVFRDRQAGISPVYDPEADRYAYNAYCLEKKLLKDLWSREFEYLDDAVAAVNDEFGTWEIETFEEKKGCGTCVAK